jgi:hypothetical protein
MINEEDFSKALLAVVEELGHTMKRLREIAESTTALGNTPKASAPIPLVTRSQIPNFDPNDLVNHDWKGKRIDKNDASKGYLKGTNYGWDFTDKFKPETIQVLRLGPETIGTMKFKLADSGGIVQFNKA